MPRCALEIAFQDCWDSAGPESRKEAALRGWERDGDKKVSRVFGAGRDLNPTFALLEELLRSNPWPVLACIERLAGVRFEVVPDSPELRHQRAIEHLERLAGEVAEALAELRASEPVERQGRVAG